MIKKIGLTLAIISTATVLMVNAQQTAKITESGIGYLEYLPPGYNSTTDNYPIVISLHGIKEKGTSSNNPSRIKEGVNKVANVGLPKYVKNGANFPFILISPQLKSKHRGWSADYVIEVLSHVKDYLRIDERRIYLTGLSLGGFGVWKTVAEFPEVFAAIVPICPGGNTITKADDIAAENIATWGFHGNKDPMVSHAVSTKMINALNSSSKKPNPMAKITIFEGMGHVIWDKVYLETNALDWMLTFRNNGDEKERDDDKDKDDKDDDKDKDKDDKDEDKDEDKENDEDGEDDKDEDETEPEPAVNVLPIVNAGPDKDLILPINSAYIEGEASDEDGSIASYEWTKISGNAANLTSTASATIKVNDLVEGTYVFRLTVKDDKDALQFDEVTITVSKDSSTNTPPTVYAGLDKTLNLPTNSVKIQGKASDDDGSIVSYQWTKMYGGAVSLSGASSAKLSLDNLEKGAYIFRFTATDNSGAIKSDFVKITVKYENTLPVVSSGPDKIISLPTNSLKIQGRASDKDGKIVSYQWAKTYGGKVRLTGANSANVLLDNLEKGVYIFRLTAKDNSGGTKSDYMKVTVKSNSDGDVIVSN